MKSNNTVEKLLSFEPAGFPFISLYLNTEPNENGQFNFNVFARKQLSEYADNFEAESSERESFDRDAERILEYLGNIKPTTKGAAIFACAGAGDFFLTREFNVPFEEDYFFVFDKPYIFPLTRLLEQNPMFAVVLADTNAANIYTFKRGHVIDQEEIQNEKTKRVAAGGWSQQRYQRSVENFHQQHAKDIVEELEKIVRDEHLDQIVLSGDEAVIIPLLRAEMSKELDEKVVEVLSLNINTPEHELMEAAEQAIFQNQTLIDKEKVDNLFEQNYDDGFGVTGVEKTLAALANGQVQELYISADFDKIEYDAKQVYKILSAYAPGEDGEVPDIRRQGKVVDELLRRAIESADSIRFIKDENLLSEVGGVGALLRYKIAKGQNV
ncbi:MAG TPA: Vms1/Ankzf1 family peptidyl-tRNA hydrolase [Pyrinomonadaceae bacterium]|jgi:peptide subunit release factor 1 (eRF1)